MSTEENFDLLFKALSNRSRRELLDLLTDGPKTTGALCEAFPRIDRCTVMQHLGVLQKAGLVVAERRGRERWNHLNAMPIHELQKRWIGPYADHAVTMLDQLQVAVEGQEPPAASGRADLKS
ncbi:ArsR/SmtB family transcription factor [Palleronia marisminoris]|nr:helix-turn-helix domain-containing protein [Palleronia marisminoris]